MIKPTQGRRAMTALAVVLAGTALLASTQAQAATKTTTKKTTTKKAAATTTAAPTTAAPVTTKASTTATSIVAGDIGTIGDATWPDGGKMTPPKDADPNGAMVFATANAINSMDPALSTATYSSAWWGPAYEPLIQANLDGSYSPSLATSWEFSSDGLTLTLNLRKNVKFQDGTPFNAAAVKANIERGKTVRGTVFAAGLAPITGVDVADDYTAKLKLSAPTAGIIDVLSDRFGTMVSPGAFNNADLGVKPVGTGPFKIVSYTPSIQAVYERWDGYWGQPAGLAKITIKTYTDAAASFNAVRTGEVDMAIINGEDQSEAGRARSISVKTVNTPLTEHALLNFNTKFADLRVRQALAYATDRKQIAGFAAVGAPTWQYAMPGSNIYDKALDNLYPLDIFKAKQLLAEAGFPNGFEFTLTYSIRPYTNDLAQILQQQWAKAGIKATLRPLDATAVVDTCLTKKACDALIGNQATRIDMAALGASTFTTGARTNLGAKGVPDIEAAVTEANAVLDPAKRLTLQRKINTLLAQQVPYMPIRSVPTLVATQNKILPGYSWTLFSNPHWNSVYVKK